MSEKVTAGLGFEKIYSSVAQLVRASDCRWQHLLATIRGKHCKFRETFKMATLSEARKGTCRDYNQCILYRMMG